MTINQTKETGAVPAGPGPRKGSYMNRATDETEQCRYVRSDDSRCPNLALPRGDDTEAVLCSAHVAKALKLVSATRDRQILAQKAG